MVTEHNHSPIDMHHWYWMGPFYRYSRNTFWACGSLTKNDMLMHWGHVGNWAFSKWGLFTPHTSPPGYWHSDEWLNEWKCALVSNRWESGEMEESLINLCINVEDKGVKIYSMNNWKCWQAETDIALSFCSNGPHAYDWLPLYIWTNPIQSQWGMSLVEWLLNNIALSYRNILLC